MKNALRAALIALVLPFLAACAGTEFIGKIGSVITASVSNPIGNTELKAILQTEITTKRIALKYLKLPTCAVDRAPWPANNCGDYKLRLAIKDGIERAIPIRKELIAFVRNNDTVNARVAYDELMRIIAIYKQAS